MGEHLCKNCFAEYYPQEGEICPVCGWDNEKEQIPAGLKYNTILNTQYVIGRAKSMNGEGITYAAYNKVSKKVVDIREFFPTSIARRNSEDNTVIPFEGNESDFDLYLDEFIELSRSVYRLKDITVVSTLIEVFEENYTAYAVYEYRPTLSLRKYVESNGPLSWNKAHNIFMPVLTALGLINSLGFAHLGISPDTIKVTSDGGLLITGFSISAARQAGGNISEEIFAGSAPIEQYTEDGVCGEISDVYSFAATFLYAISGSLPMEAPKRLEDSRLLISKEVLKELPPYAVTALANSLQVKQEQRTLSFERLRTEFSATPVVVKEYSNTEAIRVLPPVDQKITLSKGLPPIVWLIITCVITLAILFFVIFLWMRNENLKADDLGQIFTSENVNQGIIVPGILNESYDEIIKKIENNEYSFKIDVSSYEFSDTIAEGHIISQEPAEGEPIPKDNTIVVSVSRGSAKRTLPGIAGMSYAEASDLLDTNGFTVEREDQTSYDIQEGYVIGYKDHKEGDSLDYGSNITLLVSLGAESSS